MKRSYVEPETPPGDARRGYALGRGGRALLLAVGAVAAARAGLWPVACEERYPIAPTFCDDFCHATHADACGSPIDCVRDCERARHLPACERAEGVLLDCYELARREDFVCTAGGLRVAPAVCQTERDMLHECNFPGITSCLGLCRAEQEAQLAVIVDPQTLTPNLGALRQEGRTACPVLDQPCEAVCLSVPANLSGLLPFAASGAGDAGAQDAGAPQVTDAAIAASGADLPSCYEAVFRRCFVTGEPLPYKVQTLGEALLSCLLL